MSEVQAEYVKQGQWSNLDKGAVMGNTVTTTTQTSTLLVALLAVLASLASAHLWHLIAFAYYMVRANGKSTDGLFRQQQAILRTFPAPTSLLTDCVKLWRAWRHSARRALARSMAIIVFASLFSLATIVTGILSSYIIDSSNIEVLVESPHCAPIFTGEVDGQIPVRNYIGFLRTAAQSYAEDCYTNQTILPSRCRSFVRPNIPFSSKRVPCPFSPSVCALGQKDDAAVALDSGLISVREMLGLNLKDAQDIAYRSLSTCAPLSLDGRTQIINATDCPSCQSRDPLPGEEIMIMHFGTVGGDEWPNATLIHPFYEGNVTQFFSVYSHMWKGPQDPLYEPIDELKRADADVAVIQISKNLVTYANPVNDPIFAAHQEFTATDMSTGENFTSYRSDTPFGVVGCAEQYQFCATHGSETECTELGALPAEITAQNFSKASDIQLAILELLQTSSDLSNIRRAGSASLNVSSLLAMTNEIVALPDDQWAIEMGRFKAHALAGLQIAVADYAIGAKVRDPLAGPYTREPETAGEKQLCGMQKMRKSGGFANVSVFGLAFLIAMASAFLIADLLLIRFLIFVTRFRRALAPRIDRWIQDSILQLQRRAYEAEGQGTWKQFDSDVPITQADDMLTDFPKICERLRVNTNDTLWSETEIDEKGKNEQGRVNTDDTITSTREVDEKGQKEK